MNKLLVSGLSVVVALGILTSNASAHGNGRADACRTYPMAYGDSLDYVPCNVAPLPVVVVESQDNRNEDSAAVTSNTGKPNTGKTERPIKENVPSEDRPEKELLPVGDKPTK